MFEYIRVGEHNTRVSEGSEAEYQVKKIYEHPDYNKPSPINNDIAILELDRPIQFNKYVQPVCLPDKDVPVGKECYITGMYAFHTVYKRSLQSGQQHFLAFAT